MHKLLQPAELIVVQCGVVADHNRIWLREWAEMWQHGLHKRVKEAHRVHCLWHVGSGRTACELRDFPAQFGLLISNVVSLLLSAACHRKTYHPSMPSIDIGSIGRSLEPVVGSSGCGTSFDLTRVTQTFCKRIAAASFDQRTYTDKKGRPLRDP